MFLALTELRRAKVRFALLTVAIALLAFLILFQQGIQDTLVRGFVGGVRNQSAPVLVFTTDARRTLAASSIDASTADRIAAVEGVAAAGSIMQGTFPITSAGGTGPVSVVGYGTSGLGAPSRLGAGRLPAANGEVVADDEHEAEGYRVGSTVVVAPDGPVLTIVGLAPSIGINVLPTLFAEAGTYRSVLRTRNPDAAPDGAEMANVVGVQPVDGVAASTLAERVNAADPDLDALTREDAAASNPGVVSIRQSFTVILALFGLVVPLVCGLFFLILTFQKAGALTLLRALGAPARRLVAALLVQVGLVLGVGLAAAVAGYWSLTRAPSDDLAVRFEPAPVLAWLGLLGMLGIASALASVRRVLAIDPIEATTGAGVGR